MADELLLTLTFADDDTVGGRPDLSPCGAELYAAMRPLAGEDEQHGWMLAHLCEAAGRMRQAVSDLVRDSDDGPGWTLATDVDRAPGADSEIDLLPSLGQLVGVRYIEHLSDADRRAAIREREGFWRGRPASLISFASRYTDGTEGAVRLRERYNPALDAGIDAPYHGRVLIKRSRLLLEWVGRETELAARILARVPGGLIYDVLITDERDWDEVEATYADWDDVRARTTSWDDLREE